MSMQYHLDAVPVPCLALVAGMEKDKKLEVMQKKILEETNEFFEAMNDKKFNPEDAMQKGKHRERVLEEGVDLITAAITTLRLFATQEEIEKEIIKVNLKNELRGYHNEKPPEDQEIPF